MVSLTGCYYDVVEELYPSVCDVSNVTWSGTIQPLVQGNCAVPGCHVAGTSAPGDFSTYAGVKAKADDGSLRQRVVVTRDMPPSGFSNCQVKAFDVWIAAGAPQN